ncbi:MAG TPA: L-ribulose-5-phosphate 4-epimerase [Bacteroidetes bacterium]|nr:L-ribulose-5-phosphate 4-epimerase [Bacteroidota bacterium]
MLEKLKKEVWEANRALFHSGLITLTWGNVSGISHADGLFVIKPSGVEYAEMSPDDMVVVDLNGNVVEGKNRPSSDTATHLELYKAFRGIGGIAHTHSTYAVAFAQALKEIPCLGTTHADHFFGAVPVTRLLTEQEVDNAYERNTGMVILERFKQVDPLTMPAVLIAAHAPFCWGNSASDAVKNAVALEAVAKMAFDTLQLAPDIGELPRHVLQKHYERKHGVNAYYGQNKEQ